MLFNYTVRQSSGVSVPQHSWTDDNYRHCTAGVCRIELHVQCSAVQCQVPASVYPPTSTYFTCNVIINDQYDNS